MTPSLTDKNGISKTGAVRKVVLCDRTCVREGVRRVPVSREPVNNGPKEELRRLCGATHIVELYNVRQQKEVSRIVRRKEVLQ